MSRTYIRDTSPGRAVSSADSAFPANQPSAPTTGVYTEVAPLPTGVFRTEGAPALIVDISQGSSSTANTYNVLGWNRNAGLWFSVALITPSSGTQSLRTSIPNWASDYAYVVVTGSTVSATIWLIAAESITA